MHIKNGICSSDSRFTTALHNMDTCQSVQFHDDVIKWKHFPRYWSLVHGVRRSPVNSPYKGQWRQVLFVFICAWINGWVNNREPGDLKRHRAHYDITVILSSQHVEYSWVGLPLYSFWIQCSTGALFTHWAIIDKNKSVLLYCINTSYVN